MNPARSRAWCPFCLAVLAACVGLALALPARGQVSKEEHEKHHPAKDKAGQPQGKKGGMEGMGGMMEGMGGMHGKAPPKELYPSLMSLPDLPPEKREEVRQQAQERMRSGTALMSEGLDQLSQAAEREDYAAMQQATARVREGLAQFESGLAAQRALAEGRAPRDVALQWFKQEMNLLPPAGAESHRGVLGLSWFHFVVMVLLIGFAAAMLWMYFHKMRRASQLLQDLTGGAAPAPTTGAVASAGRHAAPPVPTTDGSLAPAKPAKWSGKLRVARIFQETPDVKTFRLMNPLGGVLPFAYLPGQFLTVTVAPDGKPVRRGYTIASSPTQHDHAEITVKHEEGGVVSGFLHARVQEGDLLDFSGPSGSFTFSGRECKCILLIGGGVGITPLMSVLRYLTDRSWPGDIFLIYSCHSPRDIIFREELEYLQRRHPNLRVVVTVSNADGTDWKGPTGRITKELIAQSVPDVASRYVHICGPVPLMEAARKMLAELGVPKERVKTEAFGPALGKPMPTRPTAAPPVGADEKAARVALPTVNFSQSDKSAPLPPDKPILDVADEIGVEIDNSCRVGTCGLCRVKLLSGQVTMAVEDGLEPGDKESNIILACQAKSTGNVEVEA
ncbi:MAG: 2Fe-2S iron-sulfur cluster binding domain-containing protein [Gemmataceae bacterium]|nr:2Fe-2S iron-sulfur cluster binding domain-containing protein [Gemmataceae bacterium]